MSNASTTTIPSDMRRPFSCADGSHANPARDYIVSRFSNRTVIDANRAYYGTTATAYRELMGPRERTRRWLEDTLRNVIDWRAPPASILDIGTGCGFALDTVAGFTDPKTSSLVGCDISHPMLDLASQRVPDAKIVPYNGIALPFDNATFDLVLIVSVLHHTYDPFPMLTEATRVLRRGGQLVILQEPNPRINGIVRRARKLLRRSRAELMAVAEFHQMTTNGIDPWSLVSHFRAEGLSASIEYSNAPLLDGCEKWIGRRGAGWFSPLLRLRSRWTCLSYSIVARS